MSKPFEPFDSALAWQQVHLLLDTVLYFEDAPKLLSVPSTTGESIAVPLLTETLRQMLATLPEDEPWTKLPFRFDWAEGAAEGEGELSIHLPNGERISQPTVLTAFSPV